MERPCSVLSQPQRPAEAEMEAFQLCTETVSKEIEMTRSCSRSNFLPLKRDL